jgi:hypothetical protein
LWISKDIYVYLWIYTQMNKHWISMDMKRISLYIQEDIHSYPTWYPLISFQDILEISYSVDISGYLRISQDISGYPFWGELPDVARRSSGTMALQCMVQLVVLQVLQLVARAEYHRRGPAAPGP